jgi:ABC-2 type transport system ATP-binding protein
MLDLVRRTGTEFGMAVIVASHLLGEIERVCDSLVAIDAGRLLSAAPLHTYTERTGLLAVEVDDEEGRDRLAGALGARGLRVVTDGRSVLVATSDGDPYDIVRDAIVELDLPLIRLEQRRRTLEDLFRDAPGGSVDAAPVVPAATDAAPVVPAATDAASSPTATGVATRSGPMPGAGR